MNQTFSRVVVKGGVLSPAELKQILEIAERSGLDTISFGSRQDILFINQGDPITIDPQDKFQIIRPGRKAPKTSSPPTFRPIFSPTLLG
ncbi:hypothetical protein [Algoriphagus boritolerans]|uniref:hypothetical protein n=1 Tax=Algoriphagus boritolerans TaxID=308111 RepID=UPI000AE1CB18